MTDHEALRPPPPAGVRDEVGCPAPVPAARLQETFTRSLAALTLGLVSGRPDGFYLGPLPLITLGEARPEGASGVRWPVTGGLLSRRPGGWVGFDWSEGRLAGYVTGWTPALPRLLYAALQKPVHHELTRLYLLGLRGRDPLPGPAAPRDQRRLALAIDLGLCLAVSRGRPGRFAGAALAYHAVAWTVWGQTAGGALLGQRLVAVDGSRVSPGQALARLLNLPFGSRRQDDAAGTAVVTSSG